MRLRKRQLDDEPDFVGGPLLDMAFNKLKCIHLDSIDCCRVLLAYNLIETIYISKQNPTVEILDLSHNRISVLPDDFFQNLPNLRVIKLQGNHISSIPELSACNNLEELWIGDCLGGNSISGLPALPPSLRVLMASNNRIFSIEKHSNIQIVDLSNNMLTKLPVLEGCQELRVAGNRIRGGQYSIDRMPILEFLDLTCNDLRVRLRVRPGLVILQDYGNENLSTIVVGESLLELCLKELSECSRKHIPIHLIDTS